MFALVTSEGLVHFKTDSSNRKRFEDASAKPYGRMPYSQVPAFFLESEDELQLWAQHSMRVAHAAKDKK